MNRHSKILVWFLIIAQLFLPFVAEAVPLDNVHFIKQNVTSELASKLAIFKPDEPQDVHVVVNPVYASLDSGAKWLVQEAFINELKNLGYIISVDDSAKIPKFTIDVLVLGLEANPLESGWLGFGDSKLARKSVFTGNIGLYDVEANLIRTQELHSVLTDTIMATDLASLNSTLEFAKLTAPEKKNKFLDTAIIVVVSAALIFLFLQTKSSTS